MDVLTDQIASPVAENVSSAAGLESGEKPQAEPAMQLGSGRSPNSGLNTGIDSDVALPGTDDQALLTEEDGGRLERMNQPAELISLRT